jgi:RNA polymerase sigma-70 factor (ECF subfamily)
MNLSSDKADSDWTPIAMPDQANLDARDLLSEIANGNLVAFETLYDAYSGQLFAICRRILKEEQESRDVLSEVFLEVWQKANRFDPQRGSVETFLFSIARTRSIDRLRKLNGRNYQTKKPTSISGFDEALSSNSPRPIQQMLAREVQGQVHNALGELEPTQRRLLEAAYFDGLSHSQISSQFSIPLGTVKTSIRRAILCLRQLLQRDCTLEDCK